MPETTLDNMTLRLRTMQIIAAGLIAGVLFFGVIAVTQAIGKPPGDPLLGYLGAGFAVMAAMLGSVLPTVISRSACRRLQRRADLDQAERTGVLVAIFQTKMIVALALLEGAAFLNLIAYMVTVRWWTLAAAGALIVLMTTSFPTRFRIESWIETQQQELDWES